MKDHFAKIYSEQADALFRYCFLRVSNREVAVDLTQDIFMRYWDSLVRGTTVENDKAFLFTIARHLIIDWYRKQKPTSLEALQAENEGGEDFLLADGSTNTSIELAAEARFLIDKINELSPVAQQVLYLRYVEDFAPQDIANILKIEPNAVSVRLHRGLEELRKLTGYQKDE